MSISSAKQTIAIIGIGHDFAAKVAKALCENNYRVILFDENVHKAKSAKKKICTCNADADVDIEECKHMASWEADIIVIAVDIQELESVAEKILDVATQKIVVIIAKEFSTPKMKMAEEYFPHSKLAVLVEENISGVFLYSEHARVLQEIKKLMYLTNTVVIEKRI